MKRYITVLAALLTLSLAVFAQDARNRTVDTIVGDVLAQMPAPDAATFKNNMSDIAKAAPASVEMLVGMLQPAAKAVNNKVEYAINGVTNFACDPANEAVKAAVLEGLRNGVAKQADPDAKQFIETQIRLLTPEAQAAPVFTATNSKTFSKLWDKATPKSVLKALKSDDPAYRVTALRTADKFVSEEFYSSLAKAYPKLSDAAKAEVIYWLGKNNAASQTSLILSEIGKPGQLGFNAIEAAGKLGGDAAADALLARLSESDSDAAYAALLRFNGDIRGKIADALANADDSNADALIKLASARHLTDMAPEIFNYANDPKHAQTALESLAGVVRPFQSEKIAGMLDAAEGSAVAPLQSAYSSAISKLGTGEKYANLRSIIQKATNKERFYDILASVGTDNAAADLIDAYKNGSQAALASLKKMSNYNTAGTMLEAAKKGDEAALSQFVNLVTSNEKDNDRMYSKLMEALQLSKTEAAKAKIATSLGSCPILDSFITLSDLVNSSEQKVAYAAANSAKAIAKNCVDDIDTKLVKSTLTKASEVLAATGDSDDGYAVDEIKEFLNGLEDVSPVFVLSDEEKAEGFEVLFDGTNLDKWTGNKTGYIPVNGTIYVTAQYGNESNLYTIKEYKDFIFRFEFCFVRPGANNGVGIRTPMGVDAAYDGMCEVQILDHDDPIYANLREYQVHGSVYGVIPAKRIVHKPLGEWGTEEIRVQGDHITVTVNGEVIVDGNIREACKGHNVKGKNDEFNKYTVDHKDHPGMFNKTGHIGFLGHGAGVKFRNVRVKEL